MENLEQSILSELPQVPYVMDQVGAALDWAKGELSEGEYNRMLSTVYDVTLYTKSVSEAAFFKVHYVTAAILSFLKDPKKDERFKQFDTASKAVEKALDGISVTQEKIEKIGCFKAILTTLVPLARENQDLFAVALIGVKHDILAITEGMQTVDTKAPITPQDYITILGYSLVMTELKVSNIDILDKVYPIYNGINILLNNIKY